jgi:hypothetical protein
MGINISKDCLDYSKNNWPTVISYHYGALCQGCMDVGSRSANSCPPEEVSELCPITECSCHEEEDDVLYICSKRRRKAYLRGIVCKKNNMGMS